MKYNAKIVWIQNHVYVFYDITICGELNGVSAVPIFQKGMHSIQWAKIIDFQIP